MSPIFQQMLIAETKFAQKNSLSYDDLYIQLVGAIGLLATTVKKNQHRTSFGTLRLIATLAKLPSRKFWFLVGVLR